MPGHRVRGAVSGGAVRHGTTTARNKTHTCTSKYRKGMSDYIRLVRITFVECTSVILCELCLLRGSLSVLVSLRAVYTSSG